MTDDRPSLEPLERAVNRLAEGLQRYQSDTSDLQIRDGLVQRFGLTYELSWKALKRYLKHASPNPARFDQMPFQGHIRTARELGLLLGGWPEWSGYRQMRNRTSHTYDEAVASGIVGFIPEFLEEVIHLRDRLQDRLS